MLQWPLHEQWDLYCKVRRWWISLRMCWGIPRKILWRKRYFNFCFQMLLVSLASDFLVSIENHNSEGKERKIDKGRRRTEKAIGHFLKNSRMGGGGGESVFYGKAPPRGPAPYPLYIIFDRKGAPFVFRSLTNDTPFTYLVLLMPCF